MDYRKVYDLLINSAKNHPKPELYKEKHHIVPKCLGGTNAPDNLVMLTARQHFLAHWLLFKIHKTTKLAHAWYSMCRVGKGQEERYQNSKSFEYAKKARSRKLSEDSKGEKNHFYGKRHDPETLERIRQQNIGRKASDETKAKMSAKRKGAKKSEEHKKKIGRKGLVPLRNLLSGESIRVAREVVGDYDPTVWVNPYTYKLANAEILACPHCGKEAKDSSTFRRWHFNNCKFKQHDGVKHENYEH